MSLQGQINKIQGDWVRSIRQAAMKGGVDSQGATYGTRKTRGYVCNIHGFDDDNVDLRGTVDVQEFGYDVGDSDYLGEGLHEGVSCSAISDNHNGVYIMPQMFSEVVIVQDPATYEEYVIEYSHADIIHLQSHKDITIGVVATEEFDEEDENAPDFNELRETGESATTQYDKGNLVHIVKNKDGETIIRQEADKISITVKDTSITISADGKVSLKANEIEVIGDTSLKTSSPTTNIDGDKVEVTGRSFVRRGIANNDGNGGFCAIPVCPFVNMPHTGSTITS